MKRSWVPDGGRNKGGISLHYYRTAAIVEACRIGRSRLFARAACAAMLHFTPNEVGAAERERLARNGADPDGLAERAGFEPAWDGKAPNRFRVGAGMTTSVPLR